MFSVLLEEKNASFLYLCVSFIALRECFLFPFK